MADEKERDYEAEFLADAARRAHDEELAALANLALIRSDMANLGRHRRADGGMDMDARLRDLLRDTEQGG